MPRFGYILAESGIFRILPELNIFMYIKAYSETMAYSAIFRTVDTLSQFQAGSRVIHAYSEFYLSRFRNI